MPSGPKRRRAAKKKKEQKKTAAAIIANGNGEVKVLESDSGENSSPASQELDVQQNPFTKDEVGKEPSLRIESVENENGDRDVDVMEIAVEAKDADDDKSAKASINQPSLKKSTNGSLKRESGDDGPQVDSTELLKAEKEHDKTVAGPEPFAKEAGHVADTTKVAPVVEVESNAVVLDKVIHDPESMPVDKSVANAVAELTPKKYEEKVHPSEAFSDLKAESPPLPATNFGESSRGSFTKQLSQSNDPVRNGVWCAGSSDIHQSPEKEPLLLPALGPARRNSWLGCCGLMELFTGSSR